VACCTPSTCATEEHDPDLGHADARTVETTAYQVADLVMGRDALGGDHRRRLRQSLGRLQGAIVTVRTVEADDELAAERMIEGWVPLIGEVWAARTRLDLAEPRRQAGSKRTQNLKIEPRAALRDDLLSGPAADLHAQRRCALQRSPVGARVGVHGGMGAVAPAIV